LRPNPVLSGICPERLKPVFPARSRCLRPPRKKAAVRLRSMSTTLSGLCAEIPAQTGTGQADWVQRRCRRRLLLPLKPVGLAYPLRCRGRRRPPGSSLVSSYRYFRRFRGFQPAAVPNRMVCTHDSRSITDMPGFRRGAGRYCRHCRSKPVWLHHLAPVGSHCCIPTASASPIEGFRRLPPKALCPESLTGLSYRRTR